MREGASGPHNRDTHGCNWHLIRPPRFPHPCMQGVIGRDRGWGGDGEGPLTPDPPLPAPLHTRGAATQASVSECFPKMGGHDLAGCQISLVTHKQQ